MKEKHPLVEAVKLKKQAKLNKANSEILKKIDKVIANRTADCLEKLFIESAEEITVNRNCKILRFPKI